MHYLIGRDLDVDGCYEFIQDMENMILTDDPYRALQITEYDLQYIDMAYLNESGFYALEADRFKVSLLERLLFKPRIRGYRPPILPPPRAPQRRGLFGFGKPRVARVVRMPRAAAPGRKPGRPKASPGRVPFGFGSRKPGRRGPGGRGPGGFGR